MTLVNMDFSKFTLLAILLVLAEAGPVYKGWKTDQGACAQQCSDNSKFDYQPGSVYEFSYNAKTMTRMNGASEDSATINMNAKVEIEPLTKCDLVMRIKEASFEDSLNDQKSQEFQEAMMKHALKFSFQDGRIDHICSTEGESIWTLNIKRGILSAFQNSMDSFDRNQNLTETDVVGTCRSEYKVVSSGRRNEVVEKTKNLLSCSNREGYRLAVQSIGYNVPSFVKSLPLMKSEYKCTQIVDLGSKILQSSSCSEEHVFRPFSYGNNGAMTRNLQTLTLDKTKKAERFDDDAFSRRSNLLFEHLFGTESQQEKEGKVEEKLRELCQTATDDVRPDLPEMMNQLAASMKEVNADVLSRLYTKITRPNFCPNYSELIKQHYLDAIPMVGTVASVKIMKEFISKKYVSENDVDLWLLSLSFIQRPSREMIEAVTPLLDVQNITGNAMLAVSSLASGYCNLRPDCGRDSEVSHLIKKLIDLTHDCNIQNGDAKRIHFALRALGNIGHSQEQVSHLSRCFTNQDAPADIRIAAIDAFRRIPCDAKRSDLMGVFRDESEDSEFRINAYIALMKCPSRNVLSEVRQVLEKEKSNQVGSFVWSHLTNLMETSDPHMQDIRHIVQDEELKKEFNLDQRKFSRNYEGSFFLDSINMGAKVDSNVIFSQKSFIPRSANLNLTIDLFGHAINFMEFGGRVQGMEKILERKFASSRGSSLKPDGLGILKNENKFGETDQFSATSYLRVFGNELRHWDTLKFRDFGQLIFDIMRKDRIEFRKSMSLLESGVVIPTCIGLPLNLTMTATGSAHLNRSRDIFRDRDMFQIKLTPSAALQVKSEMTVDGHLSKAGLKMVSVAHTSTAVTLKLAWGKVAVEIPKSKAEIFNLKSDFFIVQRNIEKKQKMLADSMRKFTICTGNTMRSVLGISLCQKVHFPNASRHEATPYFPFTGPVLYDLHMKNDDVPNGYEMTFDAEKREISLYFDTPGSKIQRLIKINITLENKYAKVVVVAPWKNMKFEGELSAEDEILKLGGNVLLNKEKYSLLAKLQVEDNRRGIKMIPYLELISPSEKKIFQGSIDYIHMKSLEVDMNAKGFTKKDFNWKVSSHFLPKEFSATSIMTIGKNEYKMLVRIGRVFKKTGFNYTPYIKITVPNRELVEVTSEIGYESNKKLAFDFKLDKLFIRPVTLNVFVAHNTDKGKNVLRIHFKAPRGSFKILGDFSKKKSVMSARIICGYTFGSKFSDRLTFSSKLRDLSLMNSARYLGIIELSSKKKEFMNFKLNGHLAKAANHVETKFDLQYGSPRNKTSNILKFSAVVNRSLKTFVHAYSYSMSIQHPGQDLNYKMEANHVQSSKWPIKKFENKMMVQMAPGKIVQTKLSYINAKVKGLPTYDGEMALSYPGRDMKIADKLMQVNRNTYENNFSVQWQKGREAMVKSTYTRTGKDINNIENTLILPNKKEVKATAMLQATSGAYKSKVYFEAEENSISKEQMLYAAEARLTKKHYGKQTSNDVSMDITWSPTKRFSANMSSIHENTSLTHKLAFSTPFSRLKFFEFETKNAWNSKKYSSLTKIYWNKKNEFRKYFSISYPGEELDLDYQTSLDMNGKESFLKLRAEKVGTKVTGSVKLNVNNSPKFNMLMSHLKEQKQRMIEGNLNFDIFGTSAGFKITHTTYLPKGEIISTGEGNIKLPFQKFKEFNTSYSLEHNSQVSSIDIDYSSSLMNFRNGKLVLEARRNLAKILKYKIQLTRMKKPLFNLEAKIERNGNYFDIDVDITNLQGEKIMTSASVSLLGRKKNSNLEIKSKHINVSVRGDLDFYNRRFVNGEVNISAKTQNLKMSVNYEKDGANHELGGSLQLPDGRSIDGKIGLIFKDAISLSLLMNSPDFPSLTNIDINISYNGDSLSSVTKGYIKILPYLKESEFEASVNMADNINLAFVLKTPFGNMRNVKATLSLQNNLANAMKIKSEFELNNNKVIDLVFSYKVESIEDFSVSFDLKTSHRRLNVVSLFLKHSGDFYNMESMLKAEVGRDVKINGKLSNFPSYNEILLKAEFKDFEDFEASLTRFGYLNDMQATVFYKLDGRERFRSKLFIKRYGAVINAMMKIPDILDFEFESELDIGNISFNLRSNLELQQEEIYKIVVTYEHLAKLYINISFPSYNDELTMTLNGDLKMFNALAKLKHNTSKYELTISNQGYYRKIDAQLVTPFFTEMASFIFNGDEETFNAQAKIMHDNDQYEMVVSNRKHYRQINIALSTPFSTDKLDIDFNGDLSSFKCFVTFSHNKVEYKLQVSNDNYYRKLNAELTFPVFHIKGSFSLEGELESFHMITEVIYNEETFKLDISNKDYYKEMTIKLITPFTKDSLSFSLDGSLSSFNAKLKYMHFKSLYELVVYNSGLYREIEVKLSTPYFRDMLSISVDGKFSDFVVQAKIMHNHNNYQLSILRSRHYRKLGVELTTPFYEGSLEFSLKGSLQSFQMTTKVLHNNEKFQLTVSTLNYYRQVNANLTTPYFKESLDFLFNGTLRRFSSQITFRHNKSLYEMKASNREFYRQMNLQLTTPFVSCDFQFEGSMQIANVDFRLNIGKLKYECNISTRKYFQISEIKLTIPKHTLVIMSNIYYKRKSITGDIKTTFDGRKFTLTGMYKDTGRKKIVKADLKTPYFEDSLHASIAGTLRKFNANLKLQHNKDVYEMVASNKNYYAEMDVSLKAPGMKAKFQSEGDLQKCEVSASLKMATNLYELTLSNQNYLRNINVEASTPQTGKFIFNFAFQGNRNHFDVVSKFSLRNKKYELNISGDSKISEYEVKVFAPQININGHFNGDLKSFSFNANVIFKKEKYEMMASTKNYFRDISGKLITPQFGEQSFSMKINGQLRDFNGFIEVKHNKELYRSEFSMANQEFRLSLPKLLEKLQVKLNGNWKNFEFIMQMMDYDGERIEIKASNKNFKEMKAHLAIPRIDNIDVLIKTNGDIRNGEATMKMAFGENVFENKVEMNFDGRQANFEIEPHYKILGRSGKAKLQIDLMFEDQSYKYELEADVEDVQFKSMASVKISSEISVLMTVNIPTFYASEMKLRLVSEGFRKTDMMLNLKSSRTGMTKIFYEHNGQMGNSFVTKGYIERDGSRLTGYSLDSYFADHYSFDFKCDYDNFKSKMETQGDLKFQGRKTIASLSVRTPFQVLKEFLISAETKMLRDSVNADVNVKLPNQEHSINIDVNSSNLNALLNVNMDKKSKNKQYQFQTSYKNTDRRDDVSRSFNFRMVLPERTVSFDSRFENTRRSLLLSSHLMWDEIRDQKAGFELMVQKGENKEGKLRIITPRRTMELYSRVEVNGSHYSTTGHIMMDVDNKDQKVDLKVDMKTSSDRADIDVTIKFPNQREGMNLKTTVNLPKGDIIFSSTSEFSIDQDPQKTFKMSTKLMSERRGQHEMYTMQMDAGHAHTGFATEVIGRVSSSPEKYNADVEMGYLTLKRQQQKFAIRGEIHTLNREANLKLEAPSKTIELDGSIRTGNRFMMSALKKESGKENMEALFKLNPNSKRMNIIFNYDEADPNKIYRIDADLMKTKANLKAYRTNKQRKQFTDGRVTVELKTNNLLQSYIKWNPDFLEELNMFGYQKLTMYGKEMKSFGDSVIHVLNDEVAMKFALAKRSFSEEMAPIRDYFATEYNSMAEDITRVMRHMNRMFEQDFLYVKTAITAINNEWHEMWLSFNRFLKGMKHMIEDFNWDLKHRMEEAKKQFDYYYGQYSMQLKNKVNEFHAYCKQKCEMLYERAMEMKTEIVSFLKDYPSTIKDLMDRMRRNPYGEKLIDFLMTMYEEANKKTVEAKEHVQTLTSAIYSAHATLNRHIAKVRRYPIVDAIMDAINEIYQQALWAYNYWDVRDNVLGLKKTLYKFGAEKIKQVKDIVTDVGMNTLIFDPKRGEIILEIRLGAAKYAYNHFMSSVEDLERAVMKLNNLMPNIDLNVWDIYYMMKPSSDLYDYIPPFKAEATLFAGQYITTFDGRHLNYKATCSYLLARDFVDGNFSVVANFDADRRAKTLKSLSLTTAHNEQVQIFPSNKVFYNGQMVKLPLKLTDATVTRQDNLIVVESKRGYKVMCDHDIQLYTVQISGWYFNKIAGLFGNYNNEPEDDMLMSNNRYTNDLEKFAQSWSVSRQCKSHRNFAPSHMVPENRDCAHFFLQSDSPFRYCFKQVNPDQFYKTCAMQLSYSKATPIDLCYVTSFYMRKCENKGVYLSMPVMCPRNI